MAEKKHVIEYTDIIKAFEKVKEKLKNKSNKGHQHGNADITDIDASKIKSGTIDIDRLPKGAIERMVYVKDDAARFALTTNTTQNGDTVKVTSTKKMFYVIDDTKLSSEAGYEAYTAESASAVPWSGVTGKPATFTPEAHTHAISEVADLQETLTGLRQDVNAKPSKDTNTTYSLIQDSTDGHKLTFKGSDGSTKTVTIPDNDHNDNTTYSLKKIGSKIQLVGSDGSTTEVTDDNTTYDLDAMINALPVGTDDPVDNDYYVSQYADGGTSNTRYYRRPVSKLWNYIKTKLATVATSGSYTDLSNKPTIGNGKVTVNQNGTTKGTFTMNQTGDTIINLTDSDTNTWRDVVDSLDSTRTDASLSANQGRVLNDKFASYLPLSGGDMTGDITFNGHGASTIGSGSQDGAGLDAKNNLNIASWYGVSFTSKCAGFAYSDKPGVSIDCRNGTLAVAGAIYANGGVVGDLTGNAKTATTANSANSAGSATKWGAAINDISTQNGSDTWLLVMSADNKVQHRLSTDFATAGHSHGLTHRDLIAAIDTASGGWDLIGGNNGFILKSIRTNASAPKWTIDNFSAAIAFGGADTKGIITIPYNYPGVKFAGGNGDSPRWYFDISGTNEKSYNLDSFLTSHQDISGKLDKSGGTITGRIVKNTNGSWVGDRDRAVVYSMYPGDDSYGCVACMPTKNGSWSMGNLGGVEHLIFNYVPDANYSANKNESIHVYLRPTEGTIALTKDIPTSLPASDVYAWAKASSKPSYSWSEIGGRPTALSSFTNDSGFIAGSDSRLTNARPASDVYSWAKASSKPSYTWTEISNKPDIPSISKDTPTRTNWTISSEYNCVVYRIGDFCLAVVAVTGTIYPRQWLPAAKLSKDFTPHTQSSIVICSVSGSDHMECMVTKDGYIKMWWSGSSPASSANICIPYYLD